MLLYHLQAGEICIASLACLWGHQAYQARAVAQTDVRLRLMPQADFQRAMADAHFRDPLLAQLARRLTDFMELIDDLFTHRLDQRLAAWLLAHGPTCHITHQQLADELGTVREIITRLLRQFHQQGWVTLDRGCIQVDSSQGQAGLRQLAQAHHGIE